MVFPAIADLSQDIAGPIPVEIVQAWLSSSKSEKDARKILGAYEQEGTVVSSDTSGLSKLSQEKDLLEVIKIINDAKEIIYGLGKQVDGEAIGRWVADNTQMFYDKKTKAEDILNVIYETNKRILSDCEVKVGFAAHQGKFLQFGGGMYGDQADFIEEIAENEASGGQILATHSLAAEIKNHPSFSFSELSNLNNSLEKVYVLDKASGFANLDITDRDYPIYFDKNFHQLIRKLNEEGVRDQIYNSYNHNRFVVLIQRGQLDFSRDTAGLLNNLSINLTFSSALKQVAQSYSNIQEIKIIGGLAIFVFDSKTAEGAIEFSKNAKDALAKDNLECTIGIDGGDVLLFPLEDNQWDIAGSPVNVASKQAQDFGKVGNIYITKKAASGVDVSSAQKYKTEISKVELNGYIL